MVILQVDHEDKHDERGKLNGEKQQLRQQHNEDKTGECGKQIQQCYKLDKTLEKSMYVTGWESVNLVQTIRNGMR